MSVSPPLTHNTKFPVTIGFRCSRLFIDVFGSVALQNSRNSVAHESRLVEFIKRNSAGRAVVKYELNCRYFTSDLRFVNYMGGHPYRHIDVLTKAHQGSS